MYTPFTTELARRIKSYCEHYFNIRRKIVSSLHLIKRITYIYAHQNHHIAVYKFIDSALAAVSGDNLTLQHHSSSMKSFAVKGPVEHSEM